MAITTVELMEKQALSIPEQAKGLIVLNNIQYLQGEELLTSCKQLETDIHAAFDPIVEKAHQAHKEAVSQRKKYLDPIEEGRRILKGKMITYQAEQEMIRKKEQIRLETEAKKRAEEEVLQMAIQAEAAGDKEIAEAIISQPVQVQSVIAPKIVPQASRLSVGRSIWSAEVVDLMALIKAVAEGKEPISFVEPNMTILNGMARSLKATINITGIKAIEKKV